MNTFQQLRFYFNKFLFPILLLIFGIVLLLKGMEVEEVKGTTRGDITLEQSEYFKFASYAIFLMALIAVLFIVGVISRIVSYILAGTIIPLTIVGMVYFSVDTVMKPVKYKEYKEKVYQEAKQRMKDIRNAQLEYKVKYGQYAPTFDELIRFLREDQVAQIKKVGTPPDRKLLTKEAYLLGMDTVTVILTQITEKQAATLGSIYRDPARKNEISSLMTSQRDKAFMHQLKGIVRDTTMVSVEHKLFYSSEAKKRQSKWEFVADSLPFVPYGEGKFVMKTDSIPKGEGHAPVFEIRNDPPMHYFDDIACSDPDSKECQESPKDTLIMGSMTTTKTNGNWK